MTIFEPGRHAEEYGFATEAEADAIESDRRRRTRRLALGIGLLLFVVCTAACVSAAIEIARIEAAR